MYEGTRGTGRRDEDTQGTHVQLGQPWESLNDAQTSNPACPLRGHARHPEDLSSQGVLVIRSRAPEPRALTPRRSLCCLHGTPRMFSQPAKLLGKAYRALQEAPPLPLPNLTVTSVIHLDALTCKHM